MVRIKDRVSGSVGLVILAGLVLAACAAQVTSAGSTGPQSSTGARSAAAPTTIPPVVYGPTAMASGQEACLMTDDVHATWTTDADGTEHVRDGWFTCKVTNNDPRVAGKARYTWNADRWHAEGDTGSMFQWGAVRLSNAGGEWAARYEGIYTTEIGDVVFMRFTGSGDYAGLSYYRWSYKTFGATWPTEGLIFPSDAEPS